MTSKYLPAQLPTIRVEAEQMAADRESWAVAARQQDLHGTAKEQELTALLLRDLARRLPEV
jgi:hypothetical protein